MNAVSAKILKKFLDLAGNRLTGEWIIIGGTVLPLIDREFRVTVDIDIVSFDSGRNEQTLKLMQIAESLGLPAEVINQAGEFFLKKVKDWKKETVLLHEGSKAKIYRPSVNLFIRLKMARLTEVDLMDCAEFLRYAHKLGEKTDTDSLLKSIRDQKKKESQIERRRRLNELESMILKLS